MKVEDNLWRLYGLGKCAQTWTWIKGKPLKGFIQLSNGISFAFKKITVVAVWRVLGRWRCELLQSHLGQPFPVFTWGDCMPHYLIDALLFW